MALRRMFSQKVIGNDRFLDLSGDARALYYHLGMYADDDGAIGSYRAALRMANFDMSALDALVEKGFVIVFESGVAFIRHWWVHNTLRKDRYTQTEYQEELATLEINERGVYVERVTVAETEPIEEAPCEAVQKTASEPEKAAEPVWQPNGNQAATQSKYKNKVKYKTTTDARAREIGTNVEKLVEKAMEKLSVFSTRQGKAVSDEGEETSGEGIPRLEEVKKFFAEHGISGDPVRFYWYNREKNAAFRDWQSYAELWGMLEHKREKPTEKKKKRPECGFDLDAFFEAACRRAYA